MVEEKIGVEDILLFQGISKSFPGVQALHNVGFSIRRGEIHTIAGENGAGKSTLMKILSGWYPPNAGEVIFKGKPIHIADPQSALSMGISTVYQELMLCENLSVVENIYLGKELHRGGGFNWKRMHERAGKLLDSFGVHIDTRAQVKTLVIAHRQIVEIAKAINLNTEVLILDEPTSSLTVNETRILFENLRKFKQQGMTIIFISHRLDEVFEVTDRISVLRDGKYLGTYKASETSPKAIISLIVGKELLKEIAAADAARACECREVVFEVRGLSRGNYFKNVSFRLHQGELLGFYGLQGAGRTELMQTLFAMYRQDAGELLLDGKPLELRSPRDAIRNGFAFIPEDRRRDGLFVNMDVKDNMAVIHDRKITLLTFVQARKVMAIAHEYVLRLAIKITGLVQRMKNLSGGNQQKVIIGRSLSTTPRILIMDEPTRGIDVGAKAEIYKILRDLKNTEKKAIIMVSSELEEVLAECDRVIVMFQGRISGEVAGAEITKERVLHLAFGGKGG